MPLRFKQKLIRLLKHERYEPRRIAHLAAELEIPDDDITAFTQAVRDLVKEGQIVLGAQEVVQLPPPGDEEIGEFRKNPRGFGFLIPRNPRAHGDIFVPPDGTLDALTGDIVRAEVVHQKRRPGDDRSPFTGYIVEVLERKQSSFSGEVVKRGSQWYVMPDGAALTDLIVIKDPEAKNAKEGDKVVFELLSHPEDNTLGEGVITEVLGASGEPDVETAAVIAAHALPGEFPGDCFEQARDAAKEFEAIMDRIDAEGFEKVMPDREDRRRDFIMTIDPPDAKDYDDAISIEPHEGGWTLGIHIADVAHFVTPGSALDTEAKERGNSVYLPRLVIPMLPELLSNGVCSLQEGVPRFCKSAFIKYDKRGEVVAKGFSQTCIQSAKRLTYLEAQALINGDLEEAKKHAKTEPNYTARVIEGCQSMDALARVIRDRRRKNGMIHLDLPDVELIFGDDGKVIDAQPEDDAFTHTIIEMFMVEANEAVARLFEELGVPLLRRIHPEPEKGGKEDLQKFVRVAGYSIPKNPDRFELQSLLDATAGTPAGPAVHFAVLRTLTAAEYSPAHIGHYALASDAYAHFTSPIRRYPDLTVHRALAEYFARTRNGSTPPKGEGKAKALGRQMLDGDNCPDEQTLVEVGGWCNQTERRAQDAERELRKFLVMQLMAEHIGEEFPGVCTGVTNAGVFVRIDKYLIEGLVKSADLPPSGPRGGQWRLDQKTGALVESGSGNSFKLGDRFGVVVSAVDLPRRQMELVIPSAEMSKRQGVGKALKLGEAAGGIAGAKAGAGFNEIRTGTQRRSKKSKSRDKHKADHRQDKKNKGKRQ
jgi:ribonuclease R